MNESTKCIEDKRQYYCARQCIKAELGVWRVIVF
jgi:hypothetical protein